MRAPNSCLAVACVAFEWAVVPFALAAALVAVAAAAPVGVGVAGSSDDINKLFERATRAGENWFMRTLCVWCVEWVDDDDFVAR